VGALGVSRGPRALGTTAGRTVSGNGTGAVPRSGGSADLSAALAGLVYRGGLNYSGADTLGITASDGRLTTSQDVTITVTSAAQQAAALQAPVAALQAAGVLTKGQAHALAVQLHLTGHSGDAAEVEGFLDHVRKLVGEGVLTPEQADTLLGPGQTLLLSVTRR
jgi:hypothetical protein